MNWLLDYHSFITRNHCGAWTPSLVAVNQVANFLVFLAYFTIPIALFSLWRIMKISDNVSVKDTWILLMFMPTVLVCGLGHLMDVLAFSWAPYRFFTLIDCLNAIAAVPLALLLPGVIRRIVETLRKLGL